MMIGRAIEAQLPTKAPKPGNAGAPIVTNDRPASDSVTLRIINTELRARMRAFLAEVPAGTYRAEDFLDDDGVTDDLPYAKRVAAHLGVQLDVVTVDAAQMAADLQQMVEVCVFIFFRISF